MAAASAHYFVCFILIYTCFVRLSIASSSPPEGETELASPEEVLPPKRQLVCADGVYQHEGRECCFCGAGQRVKQHCTAKPDDRVCVFCEDGTYNSHPNGRSKCEPCTSCSQPSANLEVAENCTSAMDTVCQCKENHYCNGQNCKICQPCKNCGTAGVEEVCTATSNTVCKEEVEEGHSLPGWVIPVLVLAVLVVLAAGGFFYWRKRRISKRKMDTGVTGTANPNENDVEMQLLHDVELRPLIPDISKVLVWKDVQDIAIRSKMPDGVIDSCKRNNPQNTEEQKLELLMSWEEKQGRSASRDLIDILQKSGEKGKLENICDILKKANAVRGNGSG